MSSRGELLLGVILATFSSGLCCDLGNTTSMAGCVRNELESGRELLKSQVEPMSLPNATGTGALKEWRVENATVRGLGNYSIKQVKVGLEDTMSLRIKFNLTWSPITLSAVGRFQFCNTTCNWLNGSLSIPMENLTGFADVLLELSVKGGRVLVQHRSTTIGLNAPTIRINIALNLLNRNIDAILGLPSRMFKKELSASYWKNKTWLVFADNTLTHLNDITKMHLPAQLGKSLSG